MESDALRAVVAKGLVALGGPGQPVAVAAPDVDALLALVTAPRPVPVVVIDRDHPAVIETIARLDALARRPLVLLIVRDFTATAPAGADAWVHEAVLGDTLALAAPPTTPAPAMSPRAIDQLLGISVLTGPLERALEAAAEEVAAAFGVDRCVISIRGDSTGSAASGTHTWDVIAWNQTAEHCRAAAAAATTLIAPPTNRAGHCESYLAVPLSTPLGSHGFLGLVVEGPRVFARASYATLQAIASRLGAELGWRAVHQRTADELERQLNAPGIDALLGIWNRIAMSQLATMHVSGAKRATTPLAAAVVDVVHLAGINTRYGLDVGDRVLRRIADAVRITVRAEDVVGRWAGDEIAILLHATTIDGAQRVAERFHTAFAARPLELPSGEVLAIEATVGLAMLQSSEEAEPFVARAAWAAKQSREGSTSVAHASTNPVPRFSDPDLRVDLRASLGGAYRLLHEISRGGMGVVYRAEDLALERPVAIKMLRPDLAEDASFVEGLRKEAAILARIQHPNLVQIYTFGQSGGDSYFVMELVEGEGLQQALARHRLEGTTMPFGELIAAMDEIASALDALHERGIIHRDVKPANIIHDPFRSRSVLVDVGIARRYGQFLEAAGTPGYVAPEVITGSEATPRSDVYGLAATAYTLLTLTPPWGEGAGVLARQRSDLPITPPSTVRPELAPIDALLLGALHRDPAQRPSSASAFARSLRAAITTLSPPQLDGMRWVGTTIMPKRARTVATTRGVVFRSVTRALGARDGERLRDAIGGSDPELARALTDAAPLAWLPTELFSHLLAVAPAQLGRDRTQFARDIARATVRASFRRFFPASAATLVPERTLSAIRNVWSRYHSWGTVSSMPVQATETVVRIANTPRDPELCAWAGGMLEQLVTLSGGKTPIVDHEACEARGDDACLFRVTWQPA